MIQMGIDYFLKVFNGASEKLLGSLTVEVHIVVVVDEFQEKDVSVRFENTE